MPFKQKKGWGNTTTTEAGLVIFLYMVIASVGSFIFYILLAQSEVFGPSYSWSYLIAAGLFFLAVFMGLDYYKHNYWDQVRIQIRCESTIKPGIPLRGKITLTSHKDIKGQLRIILSGNEYGGENSVYEVFTDEIVVDRELNVRKNTHLSFPFEFIISKKEFDAWKKQIVDRAPLGGEKGFFGRLANLELSTASHYGFYVTGELKTSHGLPSRESVRVYFRP